MGRVQRSSDPTEYSAAEWVRRQLIDDIVAGRLRPGERLCEVRIATRLGCSRTPVREAFRHLGALGFAHFEKNRGGVVARLERRTMIELFDALAEVCAALAGLAAQRGEEIRRRWTEAAAASGTIWPAGTDEGGDALSLLAEPAGNRPLADALSGLRCRLLPYWRLAPTLAETWPEQGAAAQAALIDAVARGDDGAARRAARAFILSARDDLSALLPAGKPG